VPPDSDNAPATPNAVTAFVRPFRFEFRLLCDMVEASRFTPLNMQLYNNDDHHCPAPRWRAAIAAGFWFLWVRCPACRTINAIDVRTLDRHHDAAVTSLIPVLSCRSCRPNAPFAELVRLSRKSIADEMREEHVRRVLGTSKNPCG
jgi:hypothetical protein